MKSLNPYCSGQWSRTPAGTEYQLPDGCLNPYCSGQWPRTPDSEKLVKFLIRVLILIVVDNGLVLYNDYG